jgi:hypothetical protein
LEQSQLTYIICTPTNDLPAPQLPKPGISSKLSLAAITLGLPFTTVQGNSLLPVSHVSLFGALPYLYGINLQELLFFFFFVALGEKCLFTSFACSLLAYFLTIKFCSYLFFILTSYHIHGAQILSSNPSH